MNTSSLISGLTNLLRIIDNFIIWYRYYSMVKIKVEKNIFIPRGNDGSSFRIR
ncbi:MAG: hypothetical protein M3Z01_02355 [Thermoproteota archaeon]|nr:hypothetical protein [Thermoproteota archaeon]